MRFFGTMSANNTTIADPYCGAYRVCATWDAAEEDASAWTPSFLMAVFPRALLLAIGMVGARRLC